MPNENNEKSVAAQTNTTVMGVNFYIPFLEKLKFYQNFLRKQSFWQLNKLDYWEQEKVILLWAWSQTHQHLARNLDTRRLAEIYGYSKNANSEFIKVKEPEFKISERDKIISRMQQSNFGMLEPVMGNLYLKGFAEVITYKDIVYLLNSSQIEELKKECKKIFDYGLQFTVHSIIINKQGLLMGELIYEEDKGKLWKYKLTMFIIYILLFMVALVVIFTFINQIFSIVPSDQVKRLVKFIINIPSLFASAVVFILAIFIILWKKL